MKPESVATTLHQRIRFDIEEKILSGQWPPGHRIPFEHEMAQTYACSRMTVNKVLSEMAAVGLIERRRRAGSFVARPRAHTAVLHFHDIATEVQNKGEEYGYELVSAERRVANMSDRRLLGHMTAGEVIALECRHSAAGQPFALESRILNLTAVPAAAEQDFSRVAAGSWLLDQVPWTESEHDIRACGADPRQAEALGMRPGEACLVIERRTWRGNETITFARLTFPGSRHHLVARFMPARA